MSVLDVQPPKIEQELNDRNGFNLSALAVRERSVTLFFLIGAVIVGTFAYLNLGRAEDPKLPIKAFTVTAAWPGATSQDMQDPAAEPVEKRTQGPTFSFH